MNDDVITRVARGMTDVDVPASFRARVVSNLGRQATPVRWHRLTMAAATATLLILAIWLPRSTNVGSPADAPVRVAASAPQPEPIIVATDTRAPSPPRRDTRAPAMSADELAWLARSVPRLPAPIPVVLDAIQPNAQSIAPIVVEPLDTAPLEIAAIDPRAGGRH